MMRPKAGVSWTAKLRPEQEPKLVKDGSKGGTMLIPTPLLIAEQLRRVRRGQLITAATLRERLAEKFGADRTCPLTTGIFLSIVAGAAEEQIAAGERPVAPYWRVVDERGRLNPKFPPGTDRQAMHLRGEGHVVKRMKGSDRLQIVD